MLSIVFYFCKMKNWIQILFKKDNNETIDAMNKYLIVGLGNIGAEYANTRHNIGFKILDYFANKESISFQSEKFGAMAEWSSKGRSFFLLKPNTFMNLSGKAVKYWLEKEKIPIQNLLVIADDLNLSFGTIRIRSKGSDGGHNGFKNISLLLNSSDYPRFRFGISDQFKKGQQINYVLGEWTTDENQKLPERYEIANEIIKSFGLSGLEITMTTYNGK